MSGPETTTEELDEFIRSCRPGPNQATTIKKFNYADYLETAKNTSNKDLQNVANNEIEALKRALENGDAQVAEMMKRNQEDRKTAQSRLQELNQMAEQANGTDPSRGQIEEEE